MKHRLPGTRAWRHRIALSNCRLWVLMKRFAVVALAALTLCTGPVLAVAPVEVVGLFKDRALVRVAGGEHLLRAGETKGDLTLISADARSAEVEYRGERYRLALSERVSGQFRPAESTEVVISSDRWGQYWIRGAINDRFTNFLVDTGASVVAISSAHAQAMGIEYETGKPGTMQTAQGTAQSYFVSLDKVVVGGITAHNVAAAVIDGQHPAEPLLGMSFLRGVRLEEEGGVLKLTQQH